MIELKCGLHQGDSQFQVSAFASAESAGRLEEWIQLHQVLLRSSLPRRGNSVGVGSALIR
eukprot:153477-Pleurochrysis_carterae.AAC.1